MLDIQQLEVSPEVIEKAYSLPFIECDTRAPVNSYAILRDYTNPKHTAFVRYNGNKQWSTIKNSNRLVISGLKGRDSYQTALINNFLDENVLVNVVIGQAGTGKTTLALAYALEQWFNENKRIVLTKPTAMVGDGKAFGPVPGDMDEKYAPYLASYEIAIKRLMGKHAAHQLQAMKKKKDLEYVPVELIRGSEFENCTFLLDEAQNLSWHELKTVISRMGEGTKIIIMGDLRQIDTVDRKGNTLKKEQTGLYKLINSSPFQNSGISSQIELQTQYRSPITKLVADVDQWLTNPSVKLY